MGRTRSATSHRRDFRERELSQKLPQTALSRTPRSEVGGEKFPGYREAGVRGATEQYFGQGKGCGSCEDCCLGFGNLGGL